MIRFVVDQVSKATSQVYKKAVGVSNVSHVVIFIYFKTFSLWPSALECSCGFLKTFNCIYTEPLFVGF